MKRSPQSAWSAVALLGLLAMPAAFAGNNTSSATDPDFMPNTGQINPGFDEKHPSLSQARPVPSPADVRAAKMAPDNNQPSLGSSQGASATTGEAASTAPPGPIGATGQTMPAKFSKRNDTLDRVPIMAFPIALSDQDRQRIYRMVMADKAAPAADAAKLAPSNALDSNQALNEMHPLPPSLADIASVQSLAYIKTNSKVLLVEPATRIVVDEITM